MQTCPRCKETIQSDAVFCENCGLELSKPYPAVTAPEVGANAAEKPQGAPEKIRERLAILSGPVRQLRAKLHEKVSSDKAKQPPKDHVGPQAPVKRSRKVLSIILTVLTGAGVIAFWVWLLLRRTGERVVRSLFAQ